MWVGSEIRSIGGVGFHTGGGYGENLSEQGSSLMTSRKNLLGGQRRGSVVGGPKQHGEHAPLEGTVMVRREGPRKYQSQDPRPGHRRRRVTELQALDKLKCTESGGMPREKRLQGSGCV